MARRQPLRRRLVADNEAASALLRGPETKRRQAIEALAAADGGAVVPTAVRTEAIWDRRAGHAGLANQLIPDDDHLDRPGANRAAELRGVVPKASVVDACVAVAAERAAARGGPVEILSSDPGDMAALAAQLEGRFDVRRL
ncbi:MAG: hypothetical protein ACRDZX_02110 [Acidimicrobiales bacterium]